MGLQSLKTTGIQILKKSPSGVHDMIWQYVRNSCSRQSFGQLEIFGAYVNQYVTHFVVVVHWGLGNPDDPGVG